MWSRVGDDNSYKNAVSFVIVLVVKKTNKAASKPIADPSFPPRLQPFEFPLCAFLVSDDLNARQLFLFLSRLLRDLKC